ncbi:MAG: hypothetical protein ABSE73_25390, partial [Planctomycetota bacterium]
MQTWLDWCWPTPDQIPLRPRFTRARVHVSKCTAGVPPARGRPAGREDEGGRDARGTLWATHLL